MSPGVGSPQGRVNSTVSKSHFKSQSNIYRIISLDGFPHLSFSKAVLISTIGEVGHATETYFTTTVEAKRAQQSAVWVSSEIPSPCLTDGCLPLVSSPG